MTQPSQQPILPLAGALIGEGLTADEVENDDQVERDSDGTAVGRDDLRADVERSGGNPDDV